MINYTIQVYRHVSEDLDSTRFTPNRGNKKHNPRQITKPQTTCPTKTKGLNSKELHRAPKDLVDSDSSLGKSPKRTARGRVIKKKNYLVSCNSESESEDKYDSDDSFLVMTSESEDEKPCRGSKKKKDKLVYLDLTKQEVEEVSLESCESPAANKSELTQSINVYIQIIMYLFFKVGSSMKY